MPSDEEKPVEVVIRWLPDDVNTLRPDWTYEQCVETLRMWDVHKGLQDRSVELGWEILECLLPETPPQTKEDES